MATFTGIEGAAALGQDDGGGPGAGRGGDGREAAAHSQQAWHAAGEDFGQEQLAWQQVSAQVEQGAVDDAGGK